ncbi:hypothetical protein IGS68_31170 (plasmid) [Skermanella sp. TT6]|uniref:YfhO family protein n=1 Tax=Skermanella cutis TaxID=2775420 RepID=A0ABX7BEU1_9PROT|nr:hypothetical protein [Skermanella sp. TT6]QQP92901.1 hypothetical protein IGS68_31170 [Skermanella sp. TT6]
MTHLNILAPRAWTGSRGLSTAAMASLAVLLAVAGGIVAELGEPGFFFRDDMQHYFMPMFMEIGGQLAQGTWPAISLRTWFGGNLVGEYQYAVYNPVSLLLYWAIHRMSDPAAAAFVFSVFHLALCSLGTFLLARAVGLRNDLAVVAAVVVSTNNMLVYWFAASWISHLVAFAWSTWAMAFLVRATEDPRHAVTAAAAIFLTLTSGFPQAAIAVAVWAAVLAGERRYRTGSFRPAAALAVSVACGVLVSLPAILPVAALVEDSMRPRGWSNNGFNTALLGDLLKFSFPSHASLLNTYGGVRSVTPPLYLTAWFALPVVLICLARRCLIAPAALLPFAAALCFAVLAQGPDQLGPFRYPFRYLPWFHLCLALACLVLLHRATRAGPRPTGAGSGLGTGVILGALSLVMFVLSVQQQPDLWRLHAGFFALHLGFSLVLAAMVRTRGTPVGAFLVASSLCFTVATHAAWPHNNILGRMVLPERPPAFVEGEAAAGGRSLQLAGHVSSGRADVMEEATSGNAFLLGEGGMINGYSPISPRGLAQRLCMGLFGWTCPDAAAELFRRDAETGLDLADLARIDRISVSRSSHLDAFLAHKPDRWLVAAEGRFMTEFRRREPLPAGGGNLSWLPPGVAVDRTPVVSDREERHVLSAGPAYRGGRLVLARAAYPGYRAELNGRPLPVEAYLGVLVSVVLPDDPSGELRVRFDPPGGTAGWLAASGGLGLLAAWLLRTRFRRRGSP